LFDPLALNSFPAYCTFIELPIKTRAGEAAMSADAKQRQLKLGLFIRPCGHHIA
jgi:hypothetical protein